METSRPVILHPWELARRMLLHGVALLPLGLLSLALGMAIYHWAAGLDWPDSFLNAAMLLGGMGPVDHIDSTIGKLLAVVAGAMLAPVVHHVLHLFHAEGKNQDPG
jgi:hypothetical protein